MGTPQTLAQREVRWGAMADGLGCKHRTELLPRALEALEATETPSMLWPYLDFDTQIEKFPSLSWSFDEALLFFQDWQPPFACDVDKLHFTPRIQRLNELEVNCNADHCSCARMFRIFF